MRNMFNLAPFQKHCLWRWALMWLPRLRCCSIITIASNTTIFVTDTHIYFGFCFCWPDLQRPCTVASAMRRAKSKMIIIKCPHRSYASAHNCFSCWFREHREPQLQSAAPHKWNGAAQTTPVIYWNWCKLRAFDAVNLDDDEIRANKANKTIVVVSDETVEHLSRMFLALRPHRPISIHLRRVIDVFICISIISILETFCTVNRMYRGQINIIVDGVRPASTCVITEFRPNLFATNFRKAKQEQTQCMRRTCTSNKFPTENQLLGQRSCILHNVDL